MPELADAFVVCPINPGLNLVVEKKIFSYSVWLRTEFKFVGH
jgi:hypothetical protein